LTVLNDFSRFIVAWKLSATMCVDDVTASFDLALSASGLDHVTVAHRQGLPTMAQAAQPNNRGQGHEHVHRTPYHPQTQGKIERCTRPSEPHSARN
jgi:RNA-directed DNA polymerase